MPCQVLPPSWCSFRVASSACVLYGIAWGGGRQWGPKSYPILSSFTYLQGSWAGRPSFSDVTMRWEQQRPADRIQGQWLRGQWIHRDCPAVHTHHSTFSSVTPPPPHTQAAISFQALGTKSGCFPNSFLLCAPRLDCGRSLPHLHPLLVRVSLSSEPIVCVHFRMHLSMSHRRTAGPSPPPALKRIRSGMREGSRLRGSSFLPLLARSAVPPPYPSPGSLPPPLLLLLVPAATPYYPCPALLAEPTFKY